MKVDGRSYRTIWYEPAAGSVSIIDQTLLPHRFEILNLRRLGDVAAAIADMRVRGAPLIGATAAYGMALALREDPSPGAEEAAAKQLIATRPTGANLRWAVDRVREALRDTPAAERGDRALVEAAAICDEDVAACQAIGDAGRSVLEEIFRAKGADAGPLQLLTHCNAGWLATVDWGTALAPIYKAHEAGMPLHVWVDETRPRNQGASLTAWELGQAGVPHTVVVDNAGGHLMQHARVDLCIVGSDRTTARGDVCNKIGTYLKALAAHDNHVPFYVALPVSTIDWELLDGLQEIPIEERDPGEVTQVSGLSAHGQVESVRLTPEATTAANYGFDVTPARLVTGLITEHGVYPARADALSDLRERLRR